MRKTFTGLTIAIFTICALVIAALLTGTWEQFFASYTPQRRAARIIIPQGVPGTDTEISLMQRRELEESLSPKIPLEEGEIVISILNRINEANSKEEQFVVFRRSAEPAGAVFITHIVFDEASRRYIRSWDAPTAATQAGTVLLFTMDIIGDRNNCIVVTGMNNRNEHTMTIFRQPDPAGPFARIAEFQADGSIVINETSRTAAQQGTAVGESFTITAFRQDTASYNIMDQLEVTYIFNPASQQFEQNRIARIPGFQIEQRRVRELLSGRPRVFEDFLHGLWYFTTPDGAVDITKYLYFDTVQREIIFFGNDTQQSFRWQTSSPTRQGLYVTSQSNSIYTLRRFVDIELESLDSIRLRVNENVRMRIMASAPWDGSYRRACIQFAQERETPLQPDIDAVFDSPWGRLRFYNSGEYTISSAGTLTRGRYVFFRLNGYNLLELRPEEDFENRGERNGPASRMSFRVENVGANSLRLLRVRIGSSGIHDLHETPILLTSMEET